MLEFVTVLQGGGALAQMALLLLIWRFDRRLVRIETKLEMHGDAIERGLNTVNRELASR